MERFKGKPDLTSNEIQTALDNPNMNWNPDERKEAENLCSGLNQIWPNGQDVYVFIIWHFFNSNHTQL